MMHQISHFMFSAKHLFILLLVLCTPFLNYGQADASLRAKSGKMQPDKTIHQKHEKHLTKTNGIRSLERIFIGPKDSIRPTFRRHPSDRNYDKSAYTKFPIAVFFNQKSILLNAEKKQAALSRYTPLFDSILSSAQLYESPIIEIFILGYTDETPMLSEDPALLRELQNRSPLDLMDEDEFRKWCAYYRAKETGLIMRTMVEQHLDQFLPFKQVLIDIIAEGRQFEMPEANRTYDMIDDKRRIAKVYWRVGQL
jgi:hypothetical protein